MLEDQAIFVTQLVTLWAVLDPISHLPLFIGATAGLDAAERRRAATIACLMAFAVLASFGLAGKFLLHAMGISLLSFQIAGGLVLFVFAVSMVLGKASVQPPLEASIQAGADPAPDGPAPRRGDAVMAIAVHPLATPIIAGPGAMLTMVLLIDNNRFSVLDQAYTVVALAVVLCLLLGIFLCGHLLERLMGRGLIQLMPRIMGLLLSALAVNLVLNALATWLKLPEI
jgi:multiple antibiotic resistance protein